MKLSWEDEPRIDDSDAIDQLRAPQEILYVSSNGSTALFDDARIVALEALANLIQTTVVVLILVALSMAFSRDANKLIIKPIEHMSKLINLYSKNPLAKQSGLDPDRPEDGTRVLERSINRIMKLLQVGLGEAGAQIIASNLSAEGKLDPLLAGKRVQAIFGFCYVRAAAAHLRHRSLLKSSRTFVHHCSDFQFQ